MKLILTRIFIFCLLGFLGCNSPKKSLGVCSLGYPLVKGFGTDSKLNSFTSTGMATEATMVDLKITMLYPRENQQERLAVGVGIAIKKTGQEALFVGGFSDVNGRFNIFMQPGIYDLEFTYGGCNTLVVKNVELLFKKMYKGEIALGIHGKEQKVFIRDFSKEG